MVGELSVSQKTSLITFIPKGGDQTSIKNWRPISLLCSDYKILSKVLTNRLSAVLVEIISREQTGGLPGRQMTDSLVGVRNLLMKIASERQSPRAVPPRAAIIGLDFAGAYDRVDRGFLYKAMVAFGFPPATIQSVQTLYETSEARVILNGTFGKPIGFETGIKQGSPLAMLLYIIYIKLLLLRFKNELVGVKIAGNPLVVGGHVDDQILFVNCDEDIRRMWGIIESFEDCTNTLINRQ